MIGRQEITSFLAFTIIIVMLAVTVEEASGHKYFTNATPYSDIYYTDSNTKWAFAKPIVDESTPGWVASYLKDYYKRNKIIGGNLIPPEDARYRENTFVSSEDIEPRHNCGFASRDSDAIAVDIGDRAKNNICMLSRPADLCEGGEGLADEFCKKIARAVGGTSDAHCFRKKICSFYVTRPWNPKGSGQAYVSLCVPEYAGVIFPCIQNNLVIIDPYYIGTMESIDAKDAESPIENAPNWAPLGIKQCGQIDNSIRNFKTSKKIIEPEQTVRGQFPWQVSMRRKRERDPDYFFLPFCGGSIISQQHILTAAHCFLKTDFIFQAIIGDFDRTISEPLEQSFLFGERQIYPHAQYNKHTEENDIAIVKLKGTITLNIYAQPICLPAKSLPYKDKLDCFISGWGKTWDSEHAGTAHTLAFARVATLNQDDCRREEIYGNRIKDTMFCAGSFQGGADSCEGDSGGPIVCDVQDEYKKHYLIQLGIVSFGIGCGKFNKPGVYTKLSKYQEWMDKTIQDSIQNIAPDVQKKIYSKRGPPPC